MNGSSLYLAATLFTCFSAATAQEVQSVKPQEAETTAQLPSGSEAPPEAEDIPCAPQPECEIWNSKFLPGISTALKNTIIIDELDHGGENALSEELNVRAFALPQSSVSTKFTSDAGSAQ